MEGWKTLRALGFGVRLPATAGRHRQDRRPLPAATPQACTAGFTAALIGRDIDAALAHLTDDVVFFYSNGSVIRGKDAFAAAMTASWKIVEDYRYATLDSAWVGETDAAAAVIYRFEWSGMAGGNAVSGAGRGTRVLSRTPDAGWLIAHEHLSAGDW
jgi:ketosteroid isomerase-like protein